MPTAARSYALAHHSLFARSPPSPLPPTCPNMQGPSTPRPDPSQAAPETSNFRESAAQSSEAARRSAGDLWTSLRATYNSVAETISELDFRPLGKQATFVKSVTKRAYWFREAGLLLVMHGAKGLLLMLVVGLLCACCT